MRKIVEVAAAVVLRADATFLLGRRPPGSIYAGYWEFPGGKMEAGETPRQALVRELREELGIAVNLAYPWIVREFDYAHAHVRLHFFRVTDWSGEIRALQHDALDWQCPGSNGVTPMLPANAPVLAALCLPDFYAISNATKIGVETQLALLAEKLKLGLRLVQLREPTLSVDAQTAFFTDAIKLCHDFSARVLINGDAELALKAGADGIHLKAAQLMALTSRPNFPLVAASTHNAEELTQAATLGVDFVVLGPVCATATHPGHPGIGWSALAQLIAAMPMPVFALGGLNKADLPAAWEAGAHGIAAIRSAWD